MNEKCILSIEQKVPLKTAEQMEKSSNESFSRNQTSKCFLSNRVFFFYFIIFLNFVSFESKKNILVYSEKAR
jgi:hypothetical protein